MAFTRTWDETFPADTQAANLLGQDVRNTKIDLRERLVAFAAGPIADRPTPEAAFGTANDGVTYYATDQNILYRWNGAAWVIVKDFSLGSTLLNYQTDSAAIVGTGADAVIYIYTLPANRVATGKGIRVTTGLNHNVGTANVTYKLKLNGVTLITNGASTTGGDVKNEAIIFAKSATVANIAQSFFDAAVLVSTQTPSPIGGLNFAADQTLEFDFNVANTNQVTPKIWVVELIQ